MTYNRPGLAVLWAVASLAILAIPPPAPAQTWTGTANGNWSNGSNWSSALVNGINTQLTFGTIANTANATMTDNVVGTFLLNKMTFNAGAPAYTLTGNALDFRTNGSSVLPSIVIDSNNSVTIGNALTLTNGLTVSGSGAGTFTLNGLISGAGGLTY